eukprot:COSAG02_NODE_2649_length_8330_cov_8.513605_4_plen_72_part_00
MACTRALGALDGLSKWDGGKDGVVAAVWGGASRGQRNGRPFTSREPPAGTQHSQALPAIGFYWVRSLVPRL